MVHFNFGQWHISRRKRIHSKKEKYPNPNKWTRFLDNIMYPVGLIGPFMMIPQIVKIYSEKDASSIALISWFLFLVPTILWMLYALRHKNWLILTANTAWLIAYLFMVVGAIIY